MGKKVTTVAGGSGVPTIFVDVASASLPEETIEACLAPGKPERLTADRA
jgi:hypothetical protein